MTVIVVTPNTKPRISYKMPVDLAAMRLIDAMGNPRSRKFALQEQQNARRARSRKRFSFWVAVASEIILRSQQISRLDAA
jgi:hypothetical protein